MIWIYVVIAIAGVVGALMEFYVRFLPALRANRVKRSKANEIIREEMTQLVDDAESYRLTTLYRLTTGARPKPGIRDLIGDAPVSKKILAQLSELERQSALYNRWLHESRQVVRAEIGQCRLHPTLFRAFEAALGSLPEFALGPTEGYRDEGIHEAIFKRKLTFEKAKEVVLKGRWETHVKIKLGSGEERELSFRDVIEGEDFHRFVEELQRLQERESIKTLRDVQLRLLEKARSVLKEVT